MKAKNMQAISGYFISFTPEQKEVIDRFLQDEGYSPDDEGVKKFILDVSYCDDTPEEPDTGTKIGEILKQNPEIIFRTVAGAKGLYNYLKKLHK